MRIKLNHLRGLEARRQPASINTPFTEHARNYMNEEAEYMPPVYAPEEVARTILQCAETATRDILVGGSGKVISLLEKMAPRTLDRYLERSGFAAQKKDEALHTGDALYSAAPDGSPRGRTTHRTLERSSYTRAAMSDMARLLPMIALGAVVAAAVRSLRKAASRGLRADTTRLQLLGRDACTPWIRVVTGPVVPSGARCSI